MKVWQNHKSASYRKYDRITHTHNQRTIRLGSVGSTEFKPGYISLSGLVVKTRGFISYVALNTPVFYGIVPYFSFFLYTIFWCSFDSLSLIRKPENGPIRFVFIILTEYLLLLVLLPLLPECVTV